MMAHDFTHLNLPEIVRTYTSKLNTNIFSNDGMYNGNMNHYYSCGASALSCILHSLALSKSKKPNKILDFGSGAGRVTRWLCAAFPDAEIQACDIRKSDLTFIQETFGIKAWESGVHVDSLIPDGKYDLIWVGSVFTHLSAAVSANLFDKLMSWLTPNGLLIFSLHGRFVFHRLNKEQDQQFPPYPYYFYKHPVVSVFL